MSVKAVHLNEKLSVPERPACSIIPSTHTNFSVSNLSRSSVREPQSKDDYRVGEIEKEINLLESVCKAMCADLEHSPLTQRYVAEIQRVWDLLVKSHSNSKRMADVIKEQLQAISNNNMKLTVVHEQSKAEQKTVENLTQEVKRALRMVDTAHTREQVAQETIENLRQQINRLHSELESKSRMSDQDGEFSSMAKTKEAQAKERERMLAEISNLRERLNSAMTYQEELERKNSSADLRISELQQELENQTNEMSKESRFKERFEDELLRVKKELTVKDSQIVSLNEQIQDLQMKVLQQQNINKEIRLVNDKNSQTIDVLNQRLVKSQEEYQREVGFVEELRQTITVLTNQVKMNEEEITKLLSEVSKTANIQEMFKKKISKVEAQKNALEEQKAKLLMDLQTLQRTIREEQKKNRDDKVHLESTIRERDIVNKNLLRVNALVSEKDQLIKMINQTKLYLEHDVDNCRVELSRQTQHITALEKERDRHVADAVVLTKKLEASIDDTKLQQVAANDYKKKLAETEGRLGNKTAECENLRFELNSCTKNLNEAQEDISEFKHKSKVMTLQLEQLKEDIAGKEMQLIREQLALRKAHAEKEAMRIETQKVEAELRETRQIVSNLEVEVSSLQHVVREADSQHHRDLKEIEQLTSAREAINAQLVRRNDELALLREKTKTMQSTLDAGQKQYTQRLEDIRILKLEIQHLSAEKDVLTRSLNNMADLRSEIHHVEKELNKERVKARALEEELQNPLNTHRWRKLEGSDPSKLDLVQKVKMQQKRILEQANSLLLMEDQCADLERKRAHLETTLARYQHDQPQQQRVENCKNKLVHMEKRLKYLLVELEMRMEHVNELKAELEKTSNETITWKEKYYEQKKQVEKFKLKISDMKSSNKILNCKSLNGLESKGKGLPLLPSKSRFMGGGFNISNSSI